MGNLQQISNFIRMPEIKHLKLGAKTEIHVFRIDASDLPRLNTVPVPENITHEKKRLEYQASRMLLMNTVSGFELQNLYSSEFGKPYISGLDVEISLSHSYPYVCLMISDRPIGVDIQVYEEKILRLAPKFTSSQETDMQDRVKLTGIWSMKESVYKWWEKGQLKFKEQIKIHSWHPENQICYIDLHPYSDDYFEELIGHYRVTKEYVLTYVWRPSARAPLVL